MERLLAMARDAGVKVLFTRMPPPLLGAYLHRLRCIYLDLELTYSKRRTVLAHELGHAFYGHDCDSETNERLADAYAAKILIDPETYARLERINPDAEWIAQEMDVEPYVIVDYREYHLQQIGGAVYALPKMGAGQWAYRDVIV